MIQRLGHRTFWYGLALLTGYWGHLRRGGVFSEEDVRSIRRDFRKLTAMERQAITDIQSEYHLAFSAAILATYKRAIACGLTVPEAVEMTQASLFQFLRADAVAGRIRAALDRSKDPFRTMVSSSRDQEENFFGDSFTFQRPVDNEKNYTLLVHRCFYNDFFRRHDALFLMRIACNWDLVSWSRGIHPERHGVTFERPVTLGLDDTPCEFRFSRGT